MTLLPLHAPTPLCADCGHRTKHDAQNIGFPMFACGPMGCDYSAGIQLAPVCEVCEKSCPSGPCSQLGFWRIRAKGVSP